MSFKQKIIHIYDTQYRKLLIIPIALLVFALIQIGIQTATTGDFVNKGITLKGGSTITILNEYDSSALQQHLNSVFPGADITVRSITESGSVIGLSIDSDAQSESEIAALLASIKENPGLKTADYTVEVTGSSIGQSFFKQTLIAVLGAFVLMSIVVFIYFRTFVPSLAVILAAFSDIVVTLAIFNLTGMKLSTAGVAAFLMLIGYSVDTDILLTSRVLKRREGTVLDRIFGAIKTGMTMLMTTLVAVVAALMLTNSPVIKQIMVILLIGLIVDMINTWIQNTAILRIYVERKNKNVIQPNN